MEPYGLNCEFEQSKIACINNVSFWSKNGEWKCECFLNIKQHFFCLSHQNSKKHWAQHKLLIALDWGYEERQFLQVLQFFESNPLQRVHGRVVGKKDWQYLANIINYTLWCVRKLSCGKSFFLLTNWLNDRVTLQAFIIYQLFKNSLVASQA